MPPRQPLPPELTLQQLTERVGLFRGRGKVAAARAVGRVRLGVESRPESLVRVAIVDAGLPEPEINLSIAGWPRALSASGWSG